MFLNPRAKKEKKYFYLLEKPCSKSEQKLLWLLQQTVMFVILGKQNTCKKGTERTHKKRSLLI